VKALGKSKESYPTRRVLAKLLIDHPHPVELYVFNEERSMNVLILGD
jgi:hypothetical protein